MYLISKRIYSNQGFRICSYFSQEKKISAFMGSADMLAPTLPPCPFIMHVWTTLLKYVQSFSKSRTPFSTSSRDISQLQIDPIISVSKGSYPTSSLYMYKSTSISTNQHVQVQSFFLQVNQSCRSSQSSQCNFIFCISPNQIIISTMFLSLNPPNNVSLSSSTKVSSLQSKISSLKHSHRCVTPTIP